MRETLDLRLDNQAALIVTDIQIDFLPGGALPVKEADQIVPVLNDYTRLFKSANAKIVISRDWHPQNHISFTMQGGPWPQHCIQNSEGAKFSPNLRVPEGAIIVSKATDPNREAYSVFDGTGLDEQLKSLVITRVFIGGLATDYCVVNSVLDARKMGLEVFVLADATRGIEANPGDVDKAFETMNQVGALQVTMSDFPEPEDLTGIESSVEIDGDKPLGKSDVKRKARMRPKGSYKQLRRERG